METAARWTAFTDELRTMLAAATQADHVRRQSVNLAALFGRKKSSPTTQPVPTPVPPSPSTIPK